MSYEIAILDRRCLSELSWSPDSYFVAIYSDKSSYLKIAICDSYHSCDSCLIAITDSSDSCLVELSQIALIAA